MAAVPGYVKVSAVNGGPLTVTLTSVTGGAVSFFTDDARTAAATLPVTVAAGGSTTLYAGTPDLFYLSVKVDGANGIEIADPEQRAPLLVELDGGATFVQVYNLAKLGLQTRTTAYAPASQAWLPNNFYKAGAVVHYGGVIYAANADFTSTGAFVVGNWTSLSSAGGASSAPTPTTVKTGAYTAAAGDLVPCDTTGGAFTVTLPFAPADKSVVVVKLVTQGASNAVTVARSSTDVFNKTGGATSITLSTPDQQVYFQYSTSGGIWFTATAIPLTSLDARYPVTTDSRLSDARTPLAHASSHGNGSSDPVSLDAQQIATGSFPIGRIPTGTSGTTVALGNDSRLSDTRTPTAHAASHAGAGSDPLALAASQITSGVLGIAQIPTGATGTTVPLGNDSRLSNNRTPTSHASTHNNGGADAVSLDAAQVATGAFATARIPALDVAQITTGIFPIARIPTGATGTTVPLGNDSRLSDSRTPTAHAASHVSAGSDSLALAATQITSGVLAIAQIPTGATGTTVPLGNDARLSDSRTPTAHAASHASGGGDPLTLAASQITSGTLGTARIPDLSATYNPVLAITASITSSGVPTSNTHEIVDASGGAVTRTLPTGVVIGTRIAVEKTDSSVNTVTVTATTLRGVGSGTSVLLAQYEVQLFEADTANTWRLVASHRTTAALDARYVSANAEVLPSDLNLVGMSYDPVVASTAGNVPTAGVLYLVKVKCTGTTITNILVHVATLGATLTSTQNLAAVYDLAGNWLKSTADQSAAWVSTGVKTMALTAPLTGLTPGYFYVALLSNGTTPPAFARANTSVLSNVGGVSGAYRFATILSTQTSMPATFTPSGMAANNVSYWVGLS